MSDALYAFPLPPSMPHLPQDRKRRFCAWLLRRCDWRVRGEFPDVSKLVLIAAPHSSWWDGVWGLLVKVAVGADIAFMGKRELFRGPLGWLLRRLGGIPIERSAAHGVVEQMLAKFAASPTLWLGIAPEGTRKHVAKWKTGFWHIARDARVPIFPIAFDYATRSIVLGPLFDPSDDLDGDLAKLRAWYAPFRGKNRNVNG